MQTMTRDELIDAIVEGLPQMELDDVDLMRIHRILFQDMSIRQLKDGTFRIEGKD
jgi:hypothetical protein